LVFWTQNQQRTHHKVGTTWPSKAIHTAIYTKGACPYTHRATDNRRTECAGLPWWSFGSRRARIGCRGSPHTFCTKPAVFRARPCQVDTVVGRAARRYCCGSLGLALRSSHNSSAGGSVQRQCQLGSDVLEKQQAWYKTYGATLCSRSLHASSRTVFNMFKKTCGTKFSTLLCSSGSDAQSTQREVYTAVLECLSCLQLESNDNFPPLYFCRYLVFREKFTWVSSRRRDAFKNTLRTARGSTNKKFSCSLWRFLMFWSEYFCCEIVCFGLDCPMVI
jgi:hypothetical protein